MIYVLDLGTARKYQVKNWSSDQGLCHILSLACCGKVVKKNGNIYMTHKAFNGRIIVEYLANACSLASSRTVPGNGRSLGVWLQEQEQANNPRWPDAQDPELGLASKCLLIG